MSFVPSFCFQCLVLLLFLSLSLFQIILLSLYFPCPVVKSPSVRCSHVLVTSCFILPFPRSRALHVQVCVSLRRLRRSPVFFQYYLMCVLRPSVFLNSLYFSLCSFIPWIPFLSPTFHFWLQPSFVCILSLYAPAIKLPLSLLFDSGVLHSGLLNRNATILHMWLWRSLSLLLGIHPLQKTSSHYTWLNI